jgi:hypothetical protein
VEDTPAYLPLEEVLDDVRVTARRKHRYERRATDPQLGGEGPVLAPIQILASASPGPSTS